MVGSLAVGYQGLGNLAWVRLAGILAFQLPQVPDLRGPLAVLLSLVKVSVQIYLPVESGWHFCLSVARVIGPLVRVAA